MHFSLWFFFNIYHLNSGTFLSFGTFTSTSANNHPQTLIFLLVFIQSRTLLQTNSTTRIRSTFFIYPPIYNSSSSHIPRQRNPISSSSQRQIVTALTNEKKQPPNRIESNQLNKQKRPNEGKNFLTVFFFDGTIYTWFTSRWEAFVIEAVQHVQFSCLLLLLRLKLFRFFRDKLPHNCRFSIT